MSLKAKWDNAHFERYNPYIWIFIEGRMLVVNDDSYSRQIKESYLHYRGKQEEIARKEHENNERKD